MAIVKLGTMVVGIRGTIGGAVFSANHSGPHVRLWAKGGNPSSAAQQTTRGRMSAFGALWNGMTDAARTNWRNFAASPPEDDYNTLGERIYPSGWQWFCRTQQRRLSVGLATSTAIPGATAVTAPASVTLTLAQLPGGACTVTWPNGTFAATDSAILFLSFNTTGGLEMKDSQRLLTYASYNPGNGPITITTAVYAKWGAIRSTWRGYAHLYKQRADGVRSTAVTTFKDVS